MKLIISGVNNYTINEVIENYIKKRIRKLSHLEKNINSITIKLDEYKRGPKDGEVNLDTFHWGTFRFSATDKDTMHLIDKLIHMVEMKLNKEHDKSVDKNKITRKESFFFNHSKGIPESTTYVAVDPTIKNIEDAYLHLTSDPDNNESDYLGFILLNKVVFMLKLSNDNVYLIASKEYGDLFGIYFIENGNYKIDPNYEIDEIKLSKKTLLDAQRDIIENSINYTVFLDDKRDMISFLIREGRGSWTLIS